MALVAVDRRSSTQSQVQRDIGDALNVYLELRRAQLPATATASLLLDRCTFLAKTYARRASSRKAFRSGRGDAELKTDALLQTLEDAEVELSAKFATNAVSAFVSVGAPTRGARLFETLRARADGPPAAEPAAAHGGRVRLRARSAASTRPSRPRARRRPRRTSTRGWATPCWRRRRRRRTCVGPRRSSRR